MIVTNITWFCNFASVSLLSTLSHKTWIASDFSLSQLSQKRSKISDRIFWKFSYKRRFSFLLISCTRDRHSTLIESYIRRDDVIKCELDLAFTERLIRYLIFTNYCHETFDRLSQIVVAKRFAERIIIRFLERREIEQIYLWLMILSNRQLSFNR